MEEVVLKLETPGIGERRIALEVSRYAGNNSLYIGLLEVTRSGIGPIEDLTVNGLCDLPVNCAYVNIPEYPEFEKFISDNELGYFTGLVKQIGLCEYPLYYFYPKRLWEICPEDMDWYEKTA